MRPSQFQPRLVSETFLIQTQRMRRGTDSFINDLKHELNEMLVLLNIWHDKTPSPLSRALRKRVLRMEGVLHRHETGANKHSTLSSNDGIEKILKGNQG